MFTEGSSKGTTGIRESGENASGIVFAGTIKSLGEGRWVTVIEDASMPDGGSIGGGIPWDFSGDRSEIHFGGQVTIDGEPLDELSDVYRKVSSDRDESPESLMRRGRGRRASQQQSLPVAHSMDV